MSNCMGEFSWEGCESHGRVCRHGAAICQQVLLTMVAVAAVAVQRDAAHCAGCAGTNVGWSRLFPVLGKVLDTALPVWSETGLDGRGLSGPYASVGLQWLRCHCSLCDWFQICCLDVIKSGVDDMTPHLSMWF